MQTYRQYCPVAKAQEILGDRWTLLIVRELVAGMEGFNDIARGLPGIPRSLLSDRLARLEAAGVVTREPRAGRGHNYRLTDAGRELKAVVLAMGKWGARWAFGPPKEEDLDPGLLLWRMQQRLNVAALPDERVTIAFDFLAGRRSQFWLVIDQGAASVCVADPGFDIGLVVSAELSAFYQVWLGKISLDHATSKGLIRIEGRPAYERAFSGWFLWSPIAGFIAAGCADGN
jgi:DNA-binding HxlR family transcriptional regulator